MPIKSCVATPVCARSCLCVHGHTCVQQHKDVVFPSGPPLSTLCLEVWQGDIRGWSAWSHVLLMAREVASQGDPESRAGGAL